MIAGLTAGLVIEDPAFRETVSAILERLHVQIAFSVADPSAEPHRLEHTNPDVLFLDFGRPGAYEALAELRRLPSPPDVIGAHASGDPEVILAGLRAGVREFVFPPVNEQLLAKALDAVSRERSQREANQRPSHAAGFISASGGCGATMLACHVASSLRGVVDSRMLLADFDVSSGLAGLWLRSTCLHSVLDAAQNLDRLDSSFWKAVISATDQRLDVLGAPPEPPGELPAPRRFLEVLRFARTLYPWVVADLGMGLNPIVASLARELDTISVVATPEITSLYHAQRTLRALGDLGVRRDRIRIVLGRWRKEQAGLEPKEIEARLRFPVALVLPEDPEEMGEAHASGRLVSPRCELGRRMTQFTAELAGKPYEEPRPSKFSLARFLTRGAYA